MIPIDVRHNIREAAANMAKLKDQLQDRAIGAAVRKTVDKARAEMTRQITGEFNIKARDVRSQLKIYYGRAGGVVKVAKLEAFGRRRGNSSRNVMLFAARQAKKGVSVAIKRSSGRKVIAGAFIANQGRTVFIREGKSRLPIRGVETIDIPQMFNTRRINEAVVKKIQADFPVELSRAISMFLAKG